MPVNSLEKILNEEIVLCIWQATMVFFVRWEFYFQGNLNGNFSVIVFNALVAILIGSKPKQRKSADQVSLINSKNTHYHRHLAMEWVLFLSAVKRPSHGGGGGGAASSFFLNIILEKRNKPWWVQKEPEKSIMNYRGALYQTIISQTNRDNYHHSMSNERLFLKNASRLDKKTPDLFSIKVNVRWSNLSSISIVKIE